jgi:3-hydroxymyristoyl/3-hydroxydecanoyl-(acyl carrier protein) dehydratase
MAGILTAGNGSPLKLLHMGRAKFMRIVRPGETMTAVARITLQDGTLRADVQLSIGPEPCASFPLFLEPRESNL